MAIVAGAVKRQTGQRPVGLHCEERGGYMRNKWLLCLAVSVSLILSGFVGAGGAYEYTLCGRPLTVQGYITQEIDYGLVRHKYDNQSGFNSFLTSAMLEVGYQATDNMRLYASGYSEIDWAYEILGNGRNAQWDKKGFGDSRHYNYMRTNGNDLLHEAYVTWANEGFFLRVGKQIVQWGETDGWRLTNLINPIDQRRISGDVKFETTILPIWLVRAEYNAKLDTRFLTEAGVQFILDPSFQFRGNQGVMLGNEYMGVGAPYADIPLGPLGTANLGRIYKDIELPHDFDPNFFSYGLKLRGVLSDGTLLNLMGFYGRDREFVAAPSSPFAILEPPRSGSDQYDNRWLYDMVESGYHPIFKFIGFSAAKEVPQLAFQALSNIAPVFRIESMYAFNRVYGTNELLNDSKKFVKTDEFDAAISMDYKVRMKWLNPDVGITINPTFFFQRIMNLYHGYGTTLAGPNQRLEMTNVGTLGDRMNENNYKFALMLNTQYMHGKLMPMFFWMRNVTNAYDMYMFKLSYTPTSSLSYSLAGFFFGGKYQTGLETNKNKDKVVATITYSFN